MVLYRCTGGLSRAFSQPQNRLLFGDLVCRCWCHNPVRSRAHLQLVKACCHFVIKLFISLKYHLTNIITVTPLFLNVYYWWALQAHIDEGNIVKFSGFRWTGTSVVVVMGIRPISMRWWELNQSRHGDSTQDFFFRYRSLSELFDFMRCQHCAIFPFIWDLKCVLLIRTWGISV